MKNVFAPIALSACMFGITPLAHSADMPAELFGRYASESSSCAQIQKSHKETGMWDGVIVSKGGVSFIESSCDSARVSKTGAGAYALVLKCSGEGEEWDVKANYKLAGATLTISTTDGAERFKRCGK